MLSRDVRDGRQRKDAGLRSRHGAVWLRSGSGAAYRRVRLASTAHRQTGTLAQMLPGVVKGLAVIVVAIVSGEVACQESAPSFRLHVDGAADPSRVRVEYMLAGPFGGYGRQLRGSANLDIPIVVDGQAARSLRAIVFCPGYHSVRVDIPDVAEQTELRVALDALAVRRLTGTVEFADGADPRSFVLDMDVEIASSHEFFGIVDGPLTTFDVAEAVVSADGKFSLIVPDLAADERLESPRLPSALQFHARDAATGNFVFDLMPKKVAIRELPAALVLAASPN